MIGRDPDCDIVLDNIFVSRFHARLSQRGLQYELSDLDSRNGILIDGNPVEGRAMLPAGGAFTVGPFEIRIVERSQLEQVTQPFEPAAQVPSLYVDPRAHEVFVGGQAARPRLSRLEFKLVALLAEAGGAVYNRNQLGDDIWGEGEWDLNMLHRLVHRLKEKIEPAPERPRYIMTVPGVGYRLEEG